MKTTKKFPLFNAGVTLSCAFLIGATPALADTYPSTPPEVSVTNAASLQVDAILASSDNHTWRTLNHSHPIPANETKNVVFFKTNDTGCQRYLKFVWSNGEFTQTKQLNVCQNPSIRITRAGKF
ncbi:MAG: hypothetical protein PUP91_12470 [Rhizonema sp. PD37]|nr:hypothetical protein [Rhizonema sp. PD37]